MVNITDFQEWHNKIKKEKAVFEFQFWHHHCREIYLIMSRLRGNRTCGRPLRVCPEANLWHFFFGGTYISPNASQGGFSKPKPEHW